MSKIKDYTKSSFLVTLLVIGMLMCVSFIPSFRVGNRVFKRVNIFSDLYTFADESMIPVSDLELLDISFYDDYFIQPVIDTLEEAAEDEERLLGCCYMIPCIEDPAIVQIIDYSPDCQMMAKFYNSLAYEAEKRPVRVAVLGDSFIEADIITADMREQLQLAYGGNGVGFVPFSTPLSKYRGTVTHNHDGWTNYNLIKRKSVPEEYKDWFFVSGLLSVPTGNSTTEYKGVQFRRRIEKANTASIYFVNRNNSVLTISVNDGEQMVFEPEPSEEVQCISLDVPDISALKVEVSSPEGFIGYGVVLEDNVGVSVHNFSVRSNSGLALLGTNNEVNRQFHDYMNYDMVILQYGLNAMSADVTNYKHYGNQLASIIEYIKQCFPGSAIVVMSVGDRSTMQNGTAVTMPAVKAMLKAQEDAARECGVGFWNTYEAMGGDNSMPTFVERQWAAKDYTHIGYQGGKYIAEQFVKFINAAVESVSEQNVAEEHRRFEYEMSLINPTTVPGGAILLDESLRAAVDEASEGRLRLAGYIEEADMDEYTDALEADMSADLGDGDADEAELSELT